MKPPKKNRLSFAISHKKIIKPDKASFDLDITRNIESEIALNKILYFSLSSKTIEDFFKQALVEIGKLTWLCKNSKCSVYLHDFNRKNLILKARSEEHTSELQSH